MRRLILTLLVVGLLLAPAVTLATPAVPQAGIPPGQSTLGDGKAAYFPETGFWVSDPFLRFWEQNGGLPTFGYPISRVFYQDGLLRQYFERAVFERHDHLAGAGYEVLVTRLGALTTLDRRNEPPFQPVDAANDHHCRVFPATGHRLCGGFRIYWETRGGLAAFGYPISEEFIENGRTVQYFERARFEWHPENPWPHDVLLGHLGRQALAARPVPPLAVTPEGPAGPTPPIGPQPLYNHPVGCAFNVFWWGDEPNHVTNETYLDLVRDAGCDWVRVQGQWGLMEPEPGYYIFHPLDRFVDAARERGLHVLVTVNAPPAWALDIPPGTPANPVSFGRFMEVLVAHFRGRVDAWQIWNEPNIAQEAGGLIRPAGYLELLRVGSQAVRRHDPDALVVLAGMAPSSLRERTVIWDDLAYTEELLALNGGEAGRYIDVIGIHAYGAGNPPDNYWPSNPANTPAWNNAPEFYFRRAEALHAAVVNAGLGHLPIWITEFGWGTATDWPSWGFSKWVSEEDQARYLVRAYEIARTEWPWVERMFIWNLNFGAFNGDGHPFTAYALLYPDGTPRPAYEAIKAMPKE
ncbi:cellulase family glycosylhydrolase [Sphaerobacter sp.]|uniref:cellulase family glycosylhydrolase n=1 Tax=Sphaerobacter sp. TaxID=2099654 RepID=UPI001E0BC71F|nr:cellulase family glycosylhydrolase [Sphaerobacter sp.]MBX5445986.1 cellulase family glycosylhydrolase [Sphaerobacter sp.]